MSIRCFFGLHAWYPIANGHERCTRCLWLRVWSHYPIRRNVMRADAASRGTNQRVQESNPLSSTPDRAAGLREAAGRVLSGLGTCDQFDHHGNCQTHFIEKPCRVQTLRAALLDSEGQDVAWAEAEAALPEGWLGPHLIEDAPGRWIASTSCPELAEDGGYDHEDHITEETADTPPAALRALAAHLAAKGDSDAG